MMRGLIGNLRPRRDIPEPDASAQIKELEAQLQAAQLRAYEIAAAAWADGIIRSARAFPAERARLIAVYIQAAQDDAAFAGVPRERIAQLEALTAARPPHQLMGELVKTGAGGVLENNAARQPLSDERRKALLAMTPLGQAALARKEKEQ